MFKCWKACTYPLEQFTSWLPSIKYPCDNANGNANPNYAHLLVCCTEIFLGTKLYNGNCACHQIVLRLPRNVILQRTIPCTSHPDPRSNATRDFNRLRLPPNVTLVLRLPHNVTLQRTLPCTSHAEPRSNATTKCRTGAAPATQRHAATHMQRIPCTSHPDPNSNATRMLQSTAPATKCHTGAAPATQRHTATYPSLQQPPRPKLQRYQDASIDCACHQMSHWCCATASHCNAPFPAPATQSHAPTLPGCFNHLPPNVTLVLRLPHNVTLQRTIIPCTSHPEPRSNATRMLQSTAPATKCHTGAAPATQRHNSTYHSLHQPQCHVYKRTRAPRTFKSTKHLHCLIFPK